MLPNSGHKSRTENRGGWCWLRASSAFLPPLLKLDVNFRYLFQEHVQSRWDVTVEELVHELLRPRLLQHVKFGRFVPSCFFRQAIEISQVLRQRNISLFQLRELGFGAACGVSISESFTKIVEERLGGLEEVLPNALLDLVMSALF